MKIPFSSITVAWSSSIDTIDIILLLCLASCIEGELQIHEKGEFMYSNNAAMFVSSMMIGEIVGILTCVLYHILISWDKNKVILGGLCISIIFKFLAALVFSSRAFLVICFCMIGFGNGCSRFIINHSSINILATEQIALNDVIASSCSVVGELFFLFLGYLFLTSYGWRAMVILACTPTLSLLILILGIIYFPTDLSIYIYDEGGWSEVGNTCIPVHAADVNDLLAHKVWPNITWPLSMIWLLTHFARCIGLMILVYFYSMGVVSCDYRFDEMFFSSLTQIFGAILTYHVLFNMKVARAFIQATLYFLGGIFAIAPLLLLNRVSINVGCILFILGFRSCLAGSHALLGLTAIGMYPTDSRFTAITYYAIVDRISHMLATFWMVVCAEDQAMITLSMLGVLCFTSSYFSSKLPLEASSDYQLRPSIVESQNFKEGEEVTLLTSTDKSSSSSSYVGVDGHQR